MEQSVSLGDECGKCIIAKVFDDKDWIQSVYIFCDEETSGLKHKLKDGIGSRYDKEY